jgi:hypothetical protein
LIKHFGYIDTSHLPNSAEIKLQESLEKNDEDDLTLIRREKGASSACPNCGINLGADPMKANLRSDPILQSIADKLRKFLENEPELEQALEEAKEEKPHKSPEKGDADVSATSNVESTNNQVRNIIFHLLPYKPKELE